jgi:hypothetical protein
MPDFPRVVANAPTSAPPAADGVRVHADGTISGVWSGALDVAARIELINQEIL